MDTEKKLISLIIKQVASKARDVEVKNLISSNGFNWDRFKEFIAYHDLTPFVHWALKDYDLVLPLDLEKFLKNNYYCSIIRCQNIWQEFLRISGAFKQAGIDLVPIKGVAFLEDIYKDCPMRPMTDIDLLVKEKEIEKAEEIFCNLNYRKELYGLRENYWREEQCHITFYKNEDKNSPFVELHWGLDFKRKGRNILPEMWERIREIKVDGQIIKLLSWEDTLFSLALHNRRFGKTLCLKNSYDLLLLLNKYIGNFDWNYVLNQSKKYELCSTVFFILYQTNLLSNLNLPEYVWKELNLSALKRKLIQRFIESNTFLSEKKMQKRNLYLKSHFLLYDSFWEPIEYILNIPKEQFTKYYGLSTYDKKADFFYRNRLFYIPFKTILNLISKTGQRW